MAVALDFETVSSVIHHQLDPRLRYRCLVIQSNDIATVSRLARQAAEIAKELGAEVKVIEATDQFDDIGALSCDAILSCFKAFAATNPIVLEGPLHFLDYWEPATRRLFWQRLCTLSEGPGIIVVDSFRTQEIMGPFCVVERLARGSIQFLKSRLESTQDRLS